MDTKLNACELVKVVDNLLGQTTAVGESNADEAIYTNLQNAIQLTDWLLDGIVDSAETMRRPEYSMHKVGDKAFGALRDWAIWLQEVVERHKKEQRHEKQG